MWCLLIHCWSVAVLGCNHLGCSQVTNMFSVLDISLSSPYAIFRFTSYWAPSSQSPPSNLLPSSVSPGQPRKALSDFHLTNCLIGQRADWGEWKHDLSQMGSPAEKSRTLIRTDKSSRKRILHTHTETYLQVHWSAMIKTWEDKGEQWSGKQAPLGLFYSYTERQRAKQAVRWLTRAISTTQTEWCWQTDWLNNSVIDRSGQGWKGEGE